MCGHVYGHMCRLVAKTCVWAYMCGHICENGLIDMCTEVRMDMCVDICGGMCLGMCIDMCIDIWLRQVFSIECNIYQHWQMEALFHSFHHLDHPGQVQVLGLGLRFRLQVPSVAGLGNLGFGFSSLQFRIARSRAWGMRWQDVKALEAYTQSPTKEVATFARATFAPLHKLLFKTTFCPLDSS